MDILGIGPTELAFIILIALIFLGPKDMKKTGRNIGRFLRDLTSSEGWRAFRDTSRELRNLPNRLIREANIEELQKDVGRIGKEIVESTNIDGYQPRSVPHRPDLKAPQSDPQPAEAPKESKSPPKPSSKKTGKSDRKPSSDA